MRNTNSKNKGEKFGCIIVEISYFNEDCDVAVKINLKQEFCVSCILVA